MFARKKILLALGISVSIALLVTGFSVSFLFSCYVGGVKREKGLIEVELS